MMVQLDPIWPVRRSSSRSQEEMFVAKVVGATSSEDFSSYGRTME